MTRLLLSRAALAALVTTALSGCALFAPAERPKDHDAEPVGATPVATKVVAHAHAIELDARAEELVEPRARTANEVTFHYDASAKVVDALAAARPEWVFLVAHGWMNDVVSSRDFTSKVVRGVLDQSKKAGVDASKVAFVAVHWDSKRPLFHESAVNAEVIGKRRIAPFLARLAEVAPATKVVLVGHSLGGRLVLSALGAEGPATVLRAHAAVLLEAAADQDALLPERAQSLIGGFPLAPGRAKVIVNVHSRQDDVLDLAYKNAMQSPALGREGADRAVGGERFASMKLTGPVDAARLEVALREPNARWPGAPERVVVNVDATAVVKGHSEIFIDPVFELIWRVASR